jgi:hypothetical protein
MQQQINKRRAARVAASGAVKLHNIPNSAGNFSTQEDGRNPRQSTYSTSSGGGGGGGGGGGSARMARVSRSSSRAPPTSAAAAAVAAAPRRQSVNQRQSVNYSVGHWRTSVGAGAAAGAGLPAGLQPTAKLSSSSSAVAAAAATAAGRRPSVNVASSASNNSTAAAAQRVNRRQPTKQQSRMHDVGIGFDVPVNAVPVKESRRKVGLHKFNLYA